VVDGVVDGRRRGHMFKEKTGKERRREGKGREG